MFARPLPAKMVTAIAVVNPVDSAAAAKRTDVATERETENAGSEKNRE
jgi:hypothetical protein